MRGLGKAVQEAFQSIARQTELEIFTTLSADIQQLLAHRRYDILGLWTHTIASI